MVRVNLDPTIGSEIRNTRPCVVVSPDELNNHLGSVMVAPMTTQGSLYPSRIVCRFQGKTGQVVADQLRTVDGSRVTRVLGRLPDPTMESVLAVLQEMFHLCFPGSAVRGPRLVQSTGRCPAVLYFVISSGTRPGNPGPLHRLPHRIQARRSCPACGAGSSSESSRTRLHHRRHPEFR
jgi:mRNA interferase MazF